MATEVPPPVGPASGVIEVTAGTDVADAPWVGKRPPAAPVATTSTRAEASFRSFCLLCQTGAPVAPWRKREEPLDPSPLRAIFASPLIGVRPAPGQAEGGGPGRKRPARPRCAPSTALRSRRPPPRRRGDPDREHARPNAPPPVPKHPCAKAWPLSVPVAHPKTPAINPACLVLRPRCPHREPCLLACAERRFATLAGRAPVCTFGHIGWSVGCCRPRSIAALGGLIEGSYARCLGRKCLGGGLGLVLSGTHHIVECPTWPG